VVATIEAFFALRDWEGLWLTGGTCLAEYWFGHRVSVDVDLFTADPTLFRDARESLRRPSALRGVGQIETVRTDVHSCQFLLRSPLGTVVKVDLVEDIPVAIDRKVRLGGVWLDSLPDIAANKMGCLVQREEPKDLVDLFFLLPRLGLDTRQAVALGRRKDAGLDPLLLAAQLAAAVERAPPAGLREGVSWEQVVYFARRMRADLLRIIAPRPE
jgi:hypothetical protein